MGESLGRKQKTNETKGGRKYTNSCTKIIKITETKNFEIERRSYSKDFEIGDVKSTERIVERQGLRKQPVKRVNNFKRGKK
jgi:hypothetical protein